MKRTPAENNSDSLITVIPSYEVPKTFKKQTKGWNKWESKNQLQDPPGSGKFQYEYIDHYEERILVKCGSATVTPNDGSPPVTIGKGDVVIFRKGLMCTWQIHSPMVKRWCYFNKNGVEVQNCVIIICDICGIDCSDLSYEVSPKDLDLCPACFVTRRAKYKSAKKLENGKVVSKQDCTVVKAVSSENLVEVIPAKSVSEELKSLSAGWCKWESKNHPHRPPNSGKFHYTYQDHYEEKIFVEEGRATVTADDGSPAVSFGKGDFVTFRRGLTCVWEVWEPVVKRFCFFDEKGEVEGGGKITCDFCSRECSAKSYIVCPGELDLCPLCFQARGAYYMSARRLERGIVVEKICVGKTSIRSSMDELITLIPAAHVSSKLKKEVTGWSKWNSKDHPQEPANSGKFHYEYLDHYEERILVESGRASVKPDDGSSTITFGKGDYVIFRRGLSCMWEIHEPVVKRYCFFDEDGKKVRGGGVVCDLCDKDCSSRSMVISPGEIDVCPKCFKTMETYDSVKILEHGVEVEVKSFSKKKTRKTKNLTKILEHGDEIEVSRFRKKKTRSGNSKVAVQSKEGAPFVPYGKTNALEKFHPPKLYKSEKKTNICDLCGKNTRTRAYPARSDNFNLCIDCCQAARRNSKCTLVTPNIVEPLPKRDMNKLVLVVPARGVSKELIEKASAWSRWDSNTHPQEPLNSGRFHYEYLAYEEQILVISGKATITPDDGSPAISFGAGDFVSFRRGLSCVWEVHEAMVKRFCLFNEQGERVILESDIICDLCLKNCTPLSYFVKPDKLDLCPKCFKNKWSLFKSAKRLVNGKEVANTALSKKRGKCGKKRSPTVDANGSKPWKSRKLSMS